jgi:AraC-like DNA-binding protein
MMIEILAGKFRTHETRHPARDSIGPHRHSAPYIALVLEGGYEEFSVDGAWSCQPGDLVVHPAWHLHANRFRSGRSRVLNFRQVSWGASVLSLSARVWRPLDPGPLLRRGRVDADALAAVLSRSEPRTAQPPPARLARLATALKEGPERRVAALAGRLGMSREHAARSFRRHFGLTPRAFRAEARLRRALELIADPGVSLAAAAYEAGYADQAHLTRCITAATHTTPGELRRLAAGGRRITSVQ